MEPDEGHVVTESECRALFYHFHDYPANKGTPVVLDGHQFFSTANQKPVGGRAQTGLCVLSSGPLVASDRALAVNGKILLPGDMLWTNLVSDVPLCDVHACQCFNARSSPPAPADRERERQLELARLELPYPSSSRRLT